MNYNTQMINNQNHSRHSVLDTESKTPKLRFKEFSGEWEEKKLIELSENGFSNGAFNDPKKVGYGYRIINVKDMYVDGTINVNNLTRVGIDEKEFLKNRVEYGDVFFTRSSLVKEGIAYSNVNLNYADDLTFDGHLIRMRPIKEQCLPTFLYYNFTTANARKQFIIRGKTTTMTTIGQEDIASVVITLPKFSEQQKIATFLSAIDTKITLRQAQGERLKQYKKGVMQKIFSQELRFKSDDGSEFPEWEEKKLVEICLIKKGSQLNRDGLDAVGQYAVINGGITPSGYNDEWNTEANTITISEGGNSCGFVNFITEKFWSGGHCYTLDNIKNNVKDMYLFQYLKAYEIQIMRLRVGSGLPNIQKGDISKFKVKIPYYDEQTKIANFLSAIDTEIAQREAQCEQLKQFKKALLQQMFV